MWKRSRYINATTFERFLTAKEWKIIRRHDDHEQLDWQENLTVMEIYLRG